MSAQPPNTDTILFEVGATTRAEKHRRRLLSLLLLFFLLLVCVGIQFIRYLRQPTPLPSLLALPIDVNYSPHYLFSIYGVEKPVGVALSPQHDRIYVSETGGERTVKIFDRDGDPLGSFTPPRTGPGRRSPVYLATDNAGRVFVTDRLQHAVFVYDRDGTYLDTILGPDLTLTRYVSQQLDDQQVDLACAYNLFEPDLYCQEPGGTEQSLPMPESAAWSPLGIRMNGTGDMLVTDVVEDRHLVREIPGYATLANPRSGSALSESGFGAYGQGNGQFLFPNVAVTDSQGRVYVTDSNNGRISVWDDEGRFLFHLGQGAGDGALNLPRGALIDGRDRLYVVDAVGQDVKTYDVSGPEPDFLFAFGAPGQGNGQFNYPNDISLDATGRLYITDRENDRIQVWSY
jgi:DNA-binding beta-propeller fold protein YncE